MNILNIKLKKDNSVKERVYYEDIPIDFKRDGNLMRRKLLEYLPAMTITNIANFLLVSVDGIVVGNILGKDAFASVNILGPVLSLVGAITALASTGISTSLATAIGSNKQEEINRVRGASFQFMVLMAIVMAFAQIPIIKLIIDSYHLNPEMNQMVWQYATGIMICTPLGIISAVGVYQLQIIGKMRMIMRFSVLEGITNIVLDFVFVKYLNMGVAGAGYGTACANLARATATVLYLSRYTNVYKRDGYKTNLNDFREIAQTGMPDFTYLLITTIQAYLMMRILLAAFGTDGGVIKGVTGFCLSLSTILIGALQGSMRPLLGLLSGEDDRVGLSKLMESGFRLCGIGGIATTLVVMFFPLFFYSVNGIKIIPDDGITSLRLFSLIFILKGCNKLMGLYLANKKDSTFVSRLNLIGYLFLPLIAFIILKVKPGPWLWLSYVITEIIIFVILYMRYMWWKNKSIDEDYNSDNDKVLYMTVTPDKATTASFAVRNFANDYGISPKISNSVALCVEEVVAYADKIKDDKKLEDRFKNAFFKVSDNLKLPIGKFSVQIMVRFKGKNAATLTMLDDGHHIELDSGDERRKIITNNYELMQKLANTFNYQYILDMNFITVGFEDGSK